jgi:hypothetical protein
MKPNADICLNSMMQVRLKMDLGFARIAVSRLNQALDVLNENQRQESKS